MKSLSTLFLILTSAFILGACATPSRDIASSYCDGQWFDTPSKAPDTYKCKKP
jgi:starvation-inducible outer membrane lipoprotein